METYHIYMLELKLNNNDEPHFYIGKTHNITERLMNHISRNKKTTKLIKGDANHSKTRVVAICEIHKIIFDKTEIKLIKSLKDKEAKKLIDSITSKIENKFVHEKIIAKEEEFEKNIKIYRGGHYTYMWNEQKEPYQLKQYEKYKEHEFDSIISERYPIKDCLYEKTNDPEKVKYKEDYKQKIRSYIEEKVKE